MKNLHKQVRREAPRKICRTQLLYLKTETLINCNVRFHIDNCRHFKRYKHYMKHVQVYYNRDEGGGVLSHVTRSNMTFFVYLSV